MHARQRKGVWALALALLMATAGCASAQSAPVPTSGPSFADELRLARDAVTTDFERDVLDRAIASGSISDADYAEAVARYLDCTSRKGYTIDAVKLSNGIYRWQPQNVTNDQAYLNDTYVCAQGTVMVIESLYRMQVVNPDGLDPAHAAVRCLTKYDIVDDTYTVDDFNHDADDGFAHAPFDATGDMAAMCLTSLGFEITGG
ncbi:MAG: hypothetical protein J0I40_05670 [Cellulomonas sp.]|uniref:hypothetical protein n=1 Tax=Cellulomonas sp. 73-92 TaxID=1895740 RepID=UPI000AD708EC|nr:hypothetical protein [Cellulomonas sp. 73-92]MBN9374871.1 hypothetical protein [Cellulomonas sp.]